MGFAVHRMPQIGEVAPGVWLTSAFGGHGINTTAIAGELIAARHHRERRRRWRLFLPYELVWAGGRLGRLAQQVGSWSRGRHEEWAASVARRREAVRRAEAEQTGGVVAEPIRMAEPAPVRAGPGGGRNRPPSPRSRRSNPCFAGWRAMNGPRGSIPSLARTGEAPRRRPARRARVPRTQNEPENQPFTGGSPHSR